MRHGAEDSYSDDSVLGIVVYYVKVECVGSLFDVKLLNCMTFSDPKARESSLITLLECSLSVYIACIVYFVVYIHCPA